MELTQQTNQILEKLKFELGESILETKNPRERRIFVRLRQDFFEQAIEKLIKNFGLKHLSTITGTDLGQEIELLYHFSLEGSIEISIGYSISKSDPKAKTLTGLIPGAVLYEREIHELLGVEFEGHPNMLPLVLPEGWPENVFPLRKESKFEDLRKIASNK